MRILVPTTRYAKDLKRIFKRGWNKEKLSAILQLLENDTPLPAKMRQHKLTGNWQGFWECHIEPDWLLIYDFTDTEVLLARTGTHIDLFE